MKNLIKKLKAIGRDLLFFGVCSLPAIPAVALILMMDNGKNEPDETEIKCEMINSENNLVEMICKDDLKIIKKSRDLSSDEWTQFREKFNCKYTGHDSEFKCDNNIKINRIIDTYSYEWTTFKNDNHCRLVKIDETVSENKYYWQCDNNINISNDFYK